VKSEAMDFDGIVQMSWQVKMLGSAAEWRQLLNVRTIESRLRAA
jgi:hypothetical protein